MTGKQLREWACKVPDDAVIEWDHYGWIELDASKLRAIFRPNIKTDADLQTIEDEQRS